MKERTVYGIYENVEEKVMGKFSSELAGDITHDVRAMIFQEKVKVQKKTIYDDIGESYEAWREVPS